jgi:RNA polymerase sigma factor (sigma-70 family)
MTGRDEFPPQDTAQQWLHLLDDDPARAERAYAQLRRDLVRFLEWLHCVNPEEVADESIMRGMRRLSEGVATTGSNPRAYIFGVARLVAKEAWKKEAREQPSDPAVMDLQPSPLREHARIEAKRRLESALQRLTPSDRHTLIRYCTEGDRSVLCRELRVTPGHLRVMIHRIRQELRRYEAEPKREAPLEGAQPAETSSDDRSGHVRRLAEEGRGRGQPQ